MATRLLVGTALGAIALWLTFRRTDIGAVGQSLQRIRFWPVFCGPDPGSVCGDRRGAPMGADRVPATPIPDAPAVPRRPARWTDAQRLLPLRLGEVVRAYWISRSERQPLGRILSTIAVERLADVLVLGISVAVLLLQLEPPPWARNSGQVILAVSALAAIAAVALARFGEPLVRLVHVTLLVLPDHIRWSVVRQAEVPSRSSGPARIGARA
jgi:hypothetical protein